MRLSGSGGALDPSTFAGLGVLPGALRHVLHGKPKRRGPYITGGHVSPLAFYARAAVDRAQRRAHGRTVAYAPHATGWRGTAPAPALALGARDSFARGRAMLGDDGVLGPAYDPIALVSGDVAAGRAPDASVLADAKKAAAHGSTLPTIAKVGAGVAVALGAYALLKGGRR